jgi:cell cycle arrest protein BUB3
VSSWDKHVYLYETHGEEAGGNLIKKYEHRAPVLDVCFGSDDNEAFSAGMDWQVKRYEKWATRYFRAEMLIYKTG